MSHFKSEPDVALKLLKDIASEIITSVSAEEFGEKFTLLSRVDIESHSYITNHISELNEDLDRFWKTMEVEKKLKHMKNLEENAGSSPAWRPKTGEVDSISKKAACLLKTKEMLETKIKQMKEESANLQKEISEFHRNLQHQQKDMESAIDSMQF